jgi:hypothetical protein
VVRPDFDRMFTQGLCVTDGAVLPAITSVPADTRNELIGAFAANAAVLLNRVDPARVGDRVPLSATSGFSALP